MGTFKPAQKLEEIETQRERPIFSSFWAGFDCPTNIGVTRGELGVGVAKFWLLYKVFMHVTKHDVRNARVGVMLGYIYT